MAHIIPSLLDSVSTSMMSVTSSIASSLSDYTTNNNDHPTNIFPNHGRVLAEEDPRKLPYSWVIAVVIAIIASTISNFGLNLQKLAITQKQKGVPKSVYTFVWIMGMLGIVGGALCDFAALAFGAQSIVAPLGSWTLVSNVVIAPAFLGEKITRRDLISTFTIVVGCSVSVATASHDDATFTLDQLFNLYEKAAFGIYFSTVVATVISMLIAIRHVERVQAR